MSIAVWIFSEASHVAITIYSPRKTQKEDICREQSCLCGNIYRAMNYGKQQHQQEYNT